MMNTFRRHLTHRLVNTIVWQNAEQRGKTKDTNSTIEHSSRPARIASLTFQRRDSTRRAPRSIQRFAKAIPSHASHTRTLVDKLGKNVCDLPDPLSTAVKNPMRTNARVLDKQRTNARETMPEGKPLTRLRVKEEKRKAS